MSPKDRVLHGAGSLSGKGRFRGTVPPIAIKISGKFDKDEGVEYKVSGGGDAVCRYHLCSNLPVYSGPSVCKLLVSLRQLFPT